MALHTLNFYGLKCPEPVLKLAVFAKTNVQPGDTVEAVSYTHLTLPTTPYV